MGKQMIPVEFTKLLCKSGKGRGRKLFMKLFPPPTRICHMHVEGVNCEDRLGESARNISHSPNFTSQLQNLVIFHGRT